MDYPGRQGPQGAAAETAGLPRPGILLQPGTGEGGIGGDDRIELVRQEQARDAVDVRILQIRGDFEGEGYIAPMQAREGRLFVFQGV